MLIIIVYYYYSMTKPHRTVNFSVELDSVLGILASSRQESLSGLLETMLREHPEVIKTLGILRGTPMPPSMVKGNNPIPVHKNPEVLHAM